MAALLSAYAASLRDSVQQQRIQPLPVFWLACESATDRSSRTGQRKTKTATHCQSGSKLTFFLSGCGLNSQRRATKDQHPKKKLSSGEIMTLGTIKSPSALCWHQSTKYLVGSVGASF
jgi:hypothetical protein